VPKPDHVARLAGRVARERVEALGMAEVDRQALLTMLTTEHFGLQGSRASTVGESASRAALYMGAVSSTLIALGFIAQVSEEAFDVFALAVLPTLFALGVFTFVRVVESSVEDVLYGRAINRIRAYYLEQAGTEARWFMMSGHDDPLGVLANMGLRPTRYQLLFTASMMVATVNSVVGGAAVALLVAIVADPPIGVSAAAGGLAALAAFVVHRRWDRLLHERGSEQRDVMFPSR
jgi:hypothetical protein